VYDEGWKRGHGGTREDYSNHAGFIDDL
jgi:hypothetical protein